MRFRYFKVELRSRIDLPATLSAKCTFALFRATHAFKRGLFLRVDIGCMGTCCSQPFLRANMVDHVAGEGGQIHVRRSIRWIHPLGSRVFNYLCSLHSPRSIRYANLLYNNHILMISRYVSGFVSLA